MRLSRDVAVSGGTWRHARIVGRLTDSSSRSYPAGGEGAERPGPGKKTQLNRLRIDFSGSPEKDRLLSFSF